MDSIPLLAIPLKLISHLYKQNHQYFGVWELSAVIGQMLAGMLILPRIYSFILGEDPRRVAACPFAANDISRFLS
jgi:hypothetical protein